MHKYQVTDSRGEVHKRRTARTYTHAVVIHLPAKPAHNGSPASEAHTKTSWAGTERLANREAKRWESHPRFSVEVVPATVVP